jgi:DNA-binding winged helix-turn-helix (wHTH) protein
MTELTGPPWPASAQKLRLGGIEIDLRYRSVQAGGITHELNPRCFDLLILFLREPRILHTRDEIFRKVWSGVVVEDANLTSSIWMLRRAFGGAAKQWIRTVSKQGYIFDPPAAVSLELCPREILATEQAPAPEAATTDQIDVPPQRGQATVADVSARATRNRITAAIAATAVVAAVLGGTMLRVGGSPARVTQIELVTTDWTAASDKQWPSQLLHAWLDWQLRSIPNVAVANPSGGAGSRSDQTVLLSVDMSTQRDGEWRVSARFRGPSPPADITRRSSPDRLVATIDQVSRDVLTALVPAVKASSYPALPLDATAAGQLIEGLTAEQRFRWGDAARAYSGVVEKAPAFGFARVRLAQSLAEIGQQSAAQAELAHAEPWIGALPEPLRKPIQARALLIQQDYPAAAAAYAALQTNASGENLTYRLGEADSLRRAGRSRDAAERLTGELPAVPSQAVRWLILRADVEASNRDLARSAATASEAMDLAARRDWTHERAQAALLLAQAKIEIGETVAPALFEQAADGFEIAGDTLGALRARVYSEILPLTNANPSHHLDELLAQARQAGNADVEIEALRRMAIFHDRAGDIRQARERFAQAAAVAESAGNLHERHLIDLSLLQEDTLRLDFGALDKRLATLRSEPLQGRVAFSAGLNMARLQYLRGQLDASIATLKQTEDDLRDADTGYLPQMVAVISCMRISVHMVQGQAAAARNDIRDCRTSGMPVMDHFADVASAELAIHAGDLAEARRLLAPMSAMLDAQTNQQHRWNLAIEIAPLLARVGDLDAARKVLDAVLPAITKSDYLMLVANAHNTRAEIALAQDKSEEAAHELGISEAIVPADDWYERRRMRTVSALIARARGRYEEATLALDTLHGDTRRHGDVLGELLVHSLSDVTGAATACPIERRAQLVADTGMRGASDRWMERTARDTRVSMANVLH